MEAVAESMAGGNYAEARAAFKDIRDILMTGIRENVASVGPALSPITTEYKSRKGFNSEPLNESGNFLAGLDGTYGSRFAKASRGVNEWYIFLHDRGKGYSNWSHDDRATGTAKRRRKSAAERGTTRYPARRVFFMSASSRSAILDRFDAWLMNRMKAMADK